jgi:hypothetical protein
MKRALVVLGWAGVAVVAWLLSSLYMNPNIR